VRILPRAMPLIVEAVARAAASLSRSKDFDGVGPFVSMRTTRR